MHNSKPFLLVKGTFKTSWKISKKWLIHLKLEGGPSNTGFMKCVTCVQFHFKSPWGSRGSCKKMQKSCVADHEKNNEHQTTIAKWEITHFSSFDMVPMSKHVQHTFEEEHTKIIICMKGFFSP
jgi:hypothetical protein